MSNNLREHIQIVLEDKTISLDTACDLYEEAEKLIVEIEEQLPILQERCDDLRLSCQTVWTAYRKKEARRKQYTEAKHKHEIALNGVNLLKERLSQLRVQRNHAFKFLEVKDHGLH